MGSRIEKSRGIGGGIALILLGVVAFTGIGGDLPLWCPAVMVLIGVVLLVVNLA